MTAEEWSLAILVAIVGGITVANIAYIVYYIWKSR